ncbi:MAG: hypothetical protein Q7R59_03205 [bacterium]|nr:hypothetical protein [bacterium]
MEPMTEQSNIERIVMQRVHLIRALRFAISSGALSMLISLLALWGIGREVWVGRILQNAPTELFDLPRFYFSAFMHTHLLVQVLILLTFAALLFVAREIARALAFISASKSI